MLSIDYKNLGAIEQLQKPSDFELGSIASPDPIPEEYHTAYTGLIYHQHKTPSCGAHAGVYVKNIQEGKNHSPSYLWKRIKQDDGIPTESGTSMEWIFKTLQKYGVCSIDLLPNDTTLSLEKYTDTGVITPEMDTNALQSRIGAYAYDWKPTFESIKRAIYEHKVVLVRVEISADYWTPSWNKKDVLPLKTKFPGQGGHFMVLTGYSKDKIFGMNEWGTDWADKGTFYFTESYMPRVTYIGTCFDYVQKAPYVFTRTLKFGMKGTDVGIMQQILKDKGYFDNSVTSYFGMITRYAVIRFQKEKKLTSDGVVGPKTQVALVE